MISITSYAKGKKSSQSSGNGGGGGFANAQIYNNGFNPFYLWGQYIDGRDTINGDLISNGTINGNKFVGEQGNIDLIYALSEYVNYISGHTAIFDNLSGDTAHFNQDVFVGGDIDIVGDTNITGDTTIYGDLAVSGDTHLKNVWTQNINNSDTIKTKNLEVTGLAHFFQLVIDRIKAAGGAILLTPADGFETALVEEDASGYTLYFHAKDGEKQISNMWEVNDQAICQTFNASTGTSYNVSNTYYWALVTEVSEQAVQKTVSGVTEEYHYIKLSKSVYDGELNPKVGDEIAMLGSRNDEDPQRQSAIYMAAYTSLDQGLTAPCFAEYKGINDFSLSSHRHSYIDATGASFTGDFRIDNNTTIQDYVNSATTETRNEFRFDTEGLYSRVSKMTNPNILPANGWTDQDDKALLQEDDEEYIFEEPQQQSMAKGGFSEDVVSEDLIGMPPIIYLNADTYTFSIYSQVKFEDIQYGYTKDNLNMTLPVQTAFNSGDTWHSQARAITTFYAPINGYYHLGAKIMGSDYTGDYEWVDPDGESGYTPTESGITTTIHISMNQGTTILINSTGNKATATITPSDFSGNVVWASSNTNAATIDQQGNITIVGTGTTTISASIPEQYHNGKHYLGSTDSLSLNLIDHVEIVQINYTPIPNGFTVGDTHNLNASTTPTGRPLTYVSSNPSVATVTNQGVISAVSEGSAVITITAEGSIEGGVSYESASTDVVISMMNDSEYFVVLAKNPTVFTVNIGEDTNHEVSYKKNGGSTWTTIRSTTNIPLAQGEYLEMKGNIDNHPSNWRYDAPDYATTFNTDTNGRIVIFGHLMALAKNTAITDENNSFGNTQGSFNALFMHCSGLTNAENLVLADDTYDNCYYELFVGCTRLTKVPSTLSATTLTESCYDNMFRNCTSLVTAPAISATTVAYRSCRMMFNGCTSLVTAPSVLPATTLAEECYRQMFGGCAFTTPPTISATTLAEECCDSMFIGCANLAIMPQLLATTLANGCYTHMFQGCTSLTTIPTLSATTLAESCYDNMFKDCTSLVTPPVLPATELQKLCYSHMFDGCTALVNGPTLPATSLVNNCYNCMFYNCTSLTNFTVYFTDLVSGTILYWLRYNNTTGTLYCPKNATYSEQDLDLPSGWTLSKTVWTTSAQTISYTALPQSGMTAGNTHNLNASAQGTLSYSSSNPSVASVDSNGVISALTSGSTTITITAPAYDDNVNYVHYTSATTSVNVEVLMPVPQPLLNPLTDSKYFVIQARSATTLTIESVSSPTGTTAYRKNSVGEWTTANTNANTDISLNQGDYLEFKGNINHANNKYYRFKTSVAKSIDCGGYLAALEKNAEIDSSNNTVNNAFCCLFSGCTGLVNAQDLKLPDNTSTDMCRTFFRSCTNLVTIPQLPVPANGTIAVRAYQDMFADCTRLTTPPVLSASTVSENSYAYMFYRCKFVTPPDLPATNLAKGCYGYMFSGCNNLESAPTLPATTLAEACYQYMFQNCTKLENAPIISATTLATKCYAYMFNKCSKLVTAPQLPVTTLTNNCYEHMFDSCTSLVNPPSLPATTLANNCYSNMFWGCSSLVNPPSLPATTLTGGCYQGMFNGCTKLTTAPDLPATTLANSCYFYMFTGCKALTSLRVGFSTITGTRPLDAWLSSINTTGVCYCPSNAEYSASDLGLPSNWTLSKTL